MESTFYYKAFVGKSFLLLLIKTWQFLEKQRRKLHYESQKNYYPWFSWYPFNFVWQEQETKADMGCLLSDILPCSIRVWPYACVCEQETIADMCRIKLILKYSHVVSRKSSFGILEQNILSSNLERMNLEFRNRWGFSLFYISNQLHLV
jgi:hypothetical protein